HSDRSEGQARRAHRSTGRRTRVAANGVNRAGGSLVGSTFVISTEGARWTRRVRRSRWPGWSARGTAWPAGSTGGAAGSPVRACGWRWRPRICSPTRVPMGVNHPAMGEVFAWDQAVGVGGGDRDPVVAAAYDWLHNVFPVYTVLKLAFRLGFQPVDVFEP